MVPVRDGPWVLPDLESYWDATAVAVAVSGSARSERHRRGSGFSAPIGSGFGWLGFGVWVRTWDKISGVNLRPKHVGEGLGFGYHGRDVGLGLGLDLGFQ